MTPEERAEKTVKEFRDGEGYSGNDAYLSRLIASEIADAVQAAYEDAAKIADGRKFYDPEGYLAHAIRARAATLRDPEQSS